MSFNIRHGDAPDGENHWNQRKALVCQVILAADPDLIGVQEAMHFQLEELAGSLERYRWEGEGRDGGTRGEYSAIFYRPDRFKVIESGTFWLSETPEKPSITWGNACVRICSWILFRDMKSGISFSFFNTHLDHHSQNSREKSVRLIARRMADPPSGIPVILCGDFNAGENNPAVLYLTGKTGDCPLPLFDSYRILHPKDKNVGTFNGFGIEPVDEKKIDAIFVDKTASVLDARILRTSRKGRYPSDHFPVTARLRFPNHNKKQQKGTVP